MRKLLKALLQNVKRLNFVKWLISNLRNIQDIILIINELKKDKTFYDIKKEWLPPTILILSISGGEKY